MILIIFLKQNYKKIFSFMFINFIIINNKKKRIIKTVIFKWKIKKNFRNSKLNLKIINKS